MSSVDRSQCSNYPTSSAKYKGYKAITNTMLIRLIIPFYGDPKPSEIVQMVEIVDGLMTMLKRAS